MDSAEKLSAAKRWSIWGAPPYEAVLHLPSQAVIEHIQRPEKFYPPEAQMRTAAGETLSSILELMHPDLHKQDTESQEALKSLRLASGQAIMYSWRLDQAQKQELMQIYQDLQQPDPSAFQALDEIRARGLDDNIVELAEWGLITLAIKELAPNIKLPTPIADNLR